MLLAETQMYIFRIELRSLLFGWNALAVECNRKWAWRSITFSGRSIHRLRRFLMQIREICGYVFRFALDIVPLAIIITVFYELPSMPHDCFPRVVKHAKILRTKDRAGAKSTPNTPLILQEIK